MYFGYFTFEHERYEAKKNIVVTERNRKMLITAFALQIHSLYRVLFSKIELLTNQE